MSYEATPQVVTVMIDGQTETRYLSTQGYITRSSDAVPNQPFEPRIKGSISYTREVSCWVFGTGRSSGAIGTIDLDNTDGELDRWLPETWRNRLVTINRGLADDSFDNFEHIAYAVVDRISAPDLYTIRVHLRDTGALLDIPAHEGLYPALVQAPSLEGTPRPFAFGQCEGVPLTQINAALLQYDLDDTPLEAVNEVTDQGVILTEGTQWEVSTESGTYGVTRLTNPAGKQVAKIYGSEIPCTFGNTIYHLLERAAASNPDINPDGQDFDSVDGLQAATGYEYCYWGRDGTSIASILNQTLDSVTGWWYYDRNNALRVGRLNHADTVATGIVLTEINLIGDVTLRLDEAKGLADSIGCVRNWSPHGDGDVAGSVEALEPERAQRIKSPQQVRKGIYELHDTYAHARGADPPKTLLALEENGQDEADRVTQMYQEENYFYECRAALDGSLSYTLEAGEFVTLMIDRYGLANGKDLMVISVETDLLSSVVRLVLWGPGPQATDFPTG